MKSFLLILTLLFSISCSVDNNYLPDEFLDYKLQKKLTGDEAKNFVNKLHLDNVTDLNNEIGFYENETKNLIIYVTYYDNQVKAKADELKMTKKISPENSVFTAGKYLEFSGIEMYRCFGMGQSHFIFAKEAKLFWISADVVEGRKIIEKYCEIF